MLRQIPRQTTGRSSVDCSRPAQRPSPNSCRVGVCSNSLGTCSGFTRVAACVLAQPPFRGLLSRGFENHGRFGTVTSPDSYRGASTIPRAGLAPAGEVHLHGAQENQSARDFAAPSPRAGSQCESARRTRIISLMFMLASSPLRKPRSKLTSAVNCWAIYSTHQSKASAVPTPWLSQRGFLRGAFSVRQFRRCREPGGGSTGGLRSVGSGAHSPKCSRMRRMTPGSSISAMTRIGPLHLGHSSGSAS